MYSSLEQRMRIQRKDIAKQAGQDLVQGLKRSAYDKELEFFDNQKAERVGNLYTLALTGRRAPSGISTSASKTQSAVPGGLESIYTKPKASYNQKMFREKILKTDYSPELEEQLDEKIARNVLNAGINKIKALRNKREKEKFVKSALNSAVNKIVKEQENKNDYERLFGDKNKSLYNELSNLKKNTLNQLLYKNKLLNTPIKYLVKTDKNLDVFDDLVKTDRRNKLKEELALKVKNREKASQGKLYTSLEREKKKRGRKPGSLNKKTVVKAKETFGTFIRDLPKQKKTEPSYTQKSNERTLSRLQKTIEDAGKVREFKEKYGTTQTIQNYIDFVNDLEKTKEKIPDTGNGLNKKPILNKNKKKNKLY